MGSGLDLVIGPVIRKSLGHRHLFFQTVIQLKHKPMDSGTGRSPPTVAFLTCFLHTCPASHKGHPQDVQPSSLWTGVESAPCLLPLPQYPHTLLPVLSWSQESRMDHLDSSSPAVVVWVESQLWLLLLIPVGNSTPQQES